MNRTETRELLMQMIFQMEAQKDNSAFLMKKLLKEKNMSKENQTYINNTFRIISGNLDKIDDLINKYANKWKTQRMPQADLAILRLAVGEILYCEDVPVAVSIDEAVEMAKKFSSDQSQKFINGILGKVVRSINE